MYLYNVFRANVLHISLCMHVCVYVYLCVFVCFCFCVFVCLCPRVCICVHVYVCYASACTCTHMCMYVCVQNTQLTWVLKYINISHKCHIHIRTRVYEYEFIDICIVLKYMHTQRDSSLIDTFSHACTHAQTLHTRRITWCMRHGVWSVPRVRQWSRYFPISTITCVCVCVCVYLYLYLDLDLYLYI